MKPLLYTFLTVLCVLIFSCKETNTNTNPGNDATKKILTKEDSAYNEALHIHDQVMPQMGKLIGYQKKARQRADSISRFLKNADITEQAAKSVTMERESLNHLIFELKMAEKEMNDWMQGFTAEPKLPTTEERTAYFEDQKVRALKMKDQFFAALNKAKEMLGE